MIDFVVDLAAARSHILNIRMKFESKSNEEIITMPVWAPGSYMVRDFSRHISHINAEKGEIQQIDKKSYKVKGEEIIINYSIYAEELSVQTSYSDEDFVLINGSSVFFYVEGRKEEKYRVKIINSPHRHISTSMNKENEFYFMENYDDFIDTPILLHDGLSKSFDLDGKKHYVSIVGNFNRNFDEFVNEVEKIVKVTRDIFGELPYERYSFLFILAPDDIAGGLEHKNSTVIIGNENRMVDDYEYLIFKTVISHEFFHTWNVKRIRPIELGPFDYTKENYTKLLWLSEGFTSYYEWIILLRASIAKIEDYSNHLSEALNYYFIQPGYKYRDANSSSFNTWIKLYKPDGDIINNYISYYLKGELMAIALNEEILRRSNGKKTVDDFMRALWGLYKSNGKGITYNDLKNILESIGKGLGEEVLPKLAEVPGDMELTERLKRIGFKVSTQEKGNGFLGLIFTVSNGKLLVRFAIKDYPAYQSGIVPGDEVIAVDGKRMIEGYTEDYLKEWKGIKLDNIKWIKPNDTVNIALFRRNNLKILNLKAAIYPKKFKVEVEDAENVKKSFNLN